MNNGLAVHSNRFDSKFHFPGNFWISLMNFRYRIYPKYSHILLFTFPLLKFHQVHFTTCKLLKIAGRVAHIVDPDQTPRT